MTHFSYQMTPQPLISILYCIIISNVDSKKSAPVVEQWMPFELTKSGPTANATFNPFDDIEFGADFTQPAKSRFHPRAHVSFHVYGFYDGDGHYKIRFMPNTPGIWKYTTWSNYRSLDGLSGQFNCTKASSLNFGVAYVNQSRSNKSFTWSQTNHPFLSVGTTSYAFIHYPNITVQNRTLSTLKYLGNKPVFNKLRFLLFPQWTAYSHIEPLHYPYIAMNDTVKDGQRVPWNFRKFNVSFWQHLDVILTEILHHVANGNFIVDLALFHPYDHGHWVCHVSLQNLLTLLKLLGM